MGSRRRECTAVDPTIVLPHGRAPARQGPTTQRTYQHAANASRPPSDLAARTASSGARSSFRRAGCLRRCTAGGESASGPAGRHARTTRSDRRRGRRRRVAVLGTGAHPRRDRRTRRGRSEAGGSDRPIRGIEHHDRQHRSPRRPQAPHLLDVQGWQRYGAGTSRVIPRAPGSAASTARYRDSCADRRDVSSIQGLAKRTGETHTAAGPGSPIPSSASASPSTQQPNMDT